MFASLTLCLALLATPAADTVRVGDRPLALSAGVDTVDNYVLRDGTERHVVTYVQTVDVVPEGYLVVQENLGVSGAMLSLDSILLAEGSLATMWHGDVTPSGRRHVVFADGRMRGIVVDSLGRESAVDTEVPPGLFDYSVAMLVADHLPLAVGYEVTLATYDITRGPVPVSVAVLGVDTLRVGTEVHEAWRMDVTFQGPAVTRRVDRASLHELEWELPLADRRMIGRRR